MSESSVNTEQIGSVTMVSFRDASMLDAVTIQRIGRDLYKIVEAKGAQNVVLDFSHVRFLSSQALGVLLTVRRKADKAGTKVALSAIRPELARVFKITNLDKMFQFFDTNEAALDHYGETPPSAEPAQ